MGEPDGHRTRQRGAVRAGRPGDPGRGQLAGAGLPVRRRHALLRGPGRGAYVWDVDGNRYIDYVQSYGASILGHAHPKVVEAVRRAAAGGDVLRGADRAGGAAGRGDLRPGGGVRAGPAGQQRHRGGHVARSGWPGAPPDGTGWSCSPAATTVTATACWPAGAAGWPPWGCRPPPASPKAAVADTLVVPYNVVPDLGEDVACVIVEPVAANMGLVPPAPGFLEGLRRECDRAGALLIFDEVITGFRLAYGGAAEVFGVRPDLWCFGKVIGGGLPLAAFGGRRDVMEQLAPGRAGLPGRHPVREPAGDRGRPGGAVAARPGRLPGAGRPGRPVRRRAGRRPRSGPGRRGAGAGGRTAGGRVLRG